MSKWVVARKGADYKHMMEEFHISFPLARILRNREVVGDEAIRKYLQGTITDLYAPTLMKGIEEAAAFMKKAVEEGKKIRIIGDYDVDGISSTYILLKGFGRLGADVDYAIPHRMLDGYGLNENLIRQAHEAGREVIITCDNGIAAKEQIEYAHSLGMQVVVTDHHDIPFEEVDGVRHYIIPNAEVVVDPKQETDTYPNPEICGGVVAYKFLQVLIPEETDLLADLLEIAAIATVGDVMELLDENRLIVKEGLTRLSHTSNVGLKALLQVTGLWGKPITAFHIGFVIGPCINATGRLDVADTALQLLLCEDEREATLLATQLKDLNDSRKSMTESNVKIAMEQLGENPEDRVLVVFLPECHESLAGIIAGRIKEKYYRPTFVITRAEEGLKGSGRSIPGYHMQQSLTEVSHLLTKFGGHAMAAGLSLEEEQLETLRARLNELCQLTTEELEKKVVIDYPLPFEECSRALIRELELLEPFGNGNSKPVFAQSGLSVVAERIMGKNKNAGKYVMLDEKGRRYELLYFGDLDSFRTCYQSNPIKVTYYPSINEYQGRENIQFVIQDYAPCNEKKA